MCQLRLVSAAVLSLFAGSAWAQTSAPAYQDKLISGLEESSQALEAPERNATGWLRGYSLETVLDQQSSTDAQRKTGLGLRASGFIDTPFYGSLSAQVNLQQGEQGGASSRANSWVLRQVGMPFDGGWRANHQLGMIGLPAPELAQGGGRFTLPSPGMRGITTQWEQAQGLTFNGAWGQAGQFEGFPVSGFRATQGEYQMLGISHAYRGQATGAALPWAAALAQSQGVRAASGALQDASSIYLGGKLERAGGSAQFNALHSEVKPAGAAAIGVPGGAYNASGLWVDGNFSQGVHQHGWGMFYLDPNLSWLEQPMASDVQGAYWRHQWRTRQWSVQSTLELVSSISGQNAAGFFASSNARYQYSASTSYGAALTVRRFATQAQSALTYTQFSSGLGTTRLQADIASAETGERQYKVQLDQDWPEMNGLRFSTALAIDQERVQLPTLSFAQRKGISLALNAEWPINEYLNFSTTAQARSTADALQYNLSANLGWRLAANWSLNVSAYAISGIVQTAALAQSPLNAPVQNSALTKSHGVMVSLRYSADAGSASAPIGGSRGSAAGRLQGVIYLDDNANGKRDALEKPAANITVVLNGRYSTTTDAQGRYEFSYLTAGNYIVTLSSDNLPLPWGFEQEGRVRARVLTRDTTVIDIGARKQ